MSQINDPSPTDQNSEVNSGDQASDHNFTLGHGTQLWLPTKDLDADIGFFEKLGFEIKYSEDGTVVLMSDGKFVVQLDASLPQAELVIFADDVHALAAPLVDKGRVTNAEGEKTGDTEVVRLSNEGGLNVIICPVPADDSPRLYSHPESMQELSVMVDDFDAAKAWWEDLGFVKDSTYPSDGWGRMNHPQMYIGLYTSKVIQHAFNTPTLCYFGKDMEARIKTLQADGFVFHELPMSKPDSTPYAVALSPGGTMFFLFTM